MLIWIYGDYIFISNLYFPRSHHLHARWVLYLAVLTILQLQELSVCCQRGTASPGTDYKTLIQRLPVDRRVKSTNTYIQVLRKALVDTENNGCFQWTTLWGCYIMGRFIMISWPPSILGTKACNPGESSYTLLRSIILERGVPPGSPNPDLISDPNITFSTTHFQTLPLQHYVIITWVTTATTNTSLKLFPIGIFLFLSPHLWLNTIQSQIKMSKSLPVSRLSLFQAPRKSGLQT